MTEIGEVARLRQGLYRFFAGALAHPNAEHLCTLRAAAAMLDEFPISDFAYFGAWRQLCRAVSSPPGPRMLEVEYVRLFASGTDGALCPPIESFYVSHAEGGGIADAVSAIQRTYNDLGLSVTAAESPDHITSELNAVSAMCGREVDAWVTDNAEDAVRDLARQHLFLRTHLMAWFPQFRDRVRAAAPAGFYDGVVGSLQAFLVHDVDWTKALVARVQVEP